ncbi:interleukin-9 receptor-like isoform X5 [Cervus elaphus]|uniref:interleukin-9 receptor-like isoform X5 n=1 Tax=Cervus elaphus TaxID=9860 RepID=UPI001CC27D4C|nr:interleukin-9 receptor-like isoform X5 [Cervus elaphus]
MWAACVSLPREAHVTGRCSYLLNQAEGLCCKCRGGRVTSHLQVSGASRLPWAPAAASGEGQGLGLSPATITTSSGLSAAGLAQRQAREPAPGCSSPATSRWAASTSVSSGPAFAPWSCRPRRSSCLLTTSPSPSTTTSLGRSRSAWWIHSICPGDTLDPPSDLQSNVSSEHCVLTWSISPALEPLATLLSYELAFKRQEEAWEWARHKDHIVGVTWLKLEAAELDPGSAYEARLRVQMATLEGEVAEEEGYNGVWSDWSQPACFAAPLRRGRLVPALGQADSTLVAVSIFLLLSSLTYLLFKLSPRMKTALYQDVPSPGPFFQPLYSVHNGDFQTWIGACGAGPEASRDHVGPPRGALQEARVREAVALLHCDPADAWPSAGLEEEGGPGPGLPAGVLPAGRVEQAAPSPAYLPQEDRASAGHPWLAPPQCEGLSGDYCALDCSAGS